MKNDRATPPETTFTLIHSCTIILCTFCDGKYGHIHKPHLTQYNKIKDLSTEKIKRNEINTVSVKATPAKLQLQTYLAMKRLRTLRFHSKLLMVK